jgi:hypothetical protein
MNYETQLTELAEKMAREHFGAFYTTNHVYIEMCRPFAAIALAFTAEKVRKSLIDHNEPNDDAIEGYLINSGLIPHPLPHK